MKCVQHLITRAITRVSNQEAMNLIDRAPKHLARRYIYVPKKDYKAQERAKKAKA